MDPRKDDREVCGTCKYNSFCFGSKEFTCDNDESDNYGLPTDYMDSCEFWERK